MKDWIVSKFGGSSIKDSQAMIRCAEVVNKYPNTKVVIVSATYNTTNLLEQLAKAASAGNKEEASYILYDLYDKHLKMANDLNASVKTRQYFVSLFNECEAIVKGISSLMECSKRTMDHLYSIGERMSSCLFTDALKQVMGEDINIRLFDVTKILKTDSNFCRAIPNWELTKEKTKKYLIPILQDKKNIVVTQGFIGSNNDGIFTSLGREGSDFSAAIIAEAINAKQLHIWTDVPGILTADPQLVEQSKVIPEITYQEAFNIAQLGAKVLFPKTLFPVMRKNIPVLVNSSLASDGEGTWIKKNISDKKNFRAISVKANQTVVTLNCFDDCSVDQNYSRVVMDALIQHNVPFDFFSFRGVALRFVVPDKKLITADLKNYFAKTANIKIDEELCLVSLIGNNLDQQPLDILNFFKSLRREPQRLTFLGSCSHSLSFFIESSDVKRVVNELHHHLLTI